MYDNTLKTLQQLSFQLHDYYLSIENNDNDTEEDFKGENDKKIQGNDILTDIFTWDWSYA